MARTAKLSISSTKNNRKNQPFNSTQEGRRRLKSQSRRNAKSYQQVGENGVEIGEPAIAKGAIGSNRDETIQM